ncbi:hypothetical protein KP77_27570 [Jeotgalibacillus alimentarius]|uniref:SLH domain-containing protein n=1 Tax=Jeotgalibacillus alimentarius TaxID=135826 RepID=A0A0C2R8P9_9BACL|nr:S-layer homology domain-containing protein [Jeotgalibacillus alimentarius]KIL46630.1 hypothetical protein KP77_27570 [Jeotgalibacillus alimentarius]
MKKLLPALLLLLIIMPSLTGHGATFSDVTMYEEEIDWLVEKGVINGYPDGTFKPEAPVNRLNAVQMLLRDIGFSEEEINDFEGEDPGFTDLKPGMYGYEEVKFAYSLNIIGGKTDQKGESYFDPAGTLSRSQMAKVLVRTYNLISGDDLITFTDTTSLPEETQDYISRVAAAGITTGYADGSFGPYEQTSRQHFALFLKRTSDYLYEPLSDTRIHFLGDDEGDAAVIEFADQSTVLIDAGLDAAELDDQLSDIGFTEIDTFVATELSDDTLNGAVPELFVKYSIEEAVDGGGEGGTAYLEMLNDLGIGRTIIGDTDFIAGDDNATLFVEGEENGNLMLRLWNGEVSVLFAGSATESMYWSIDQSFDIVQISRKVQLRDAELNKIDPTHAILPTDYTFENYRHLDRNGVLVFSPQEQYITTAVSNGDYYFFYESPLNTLDD